MRKFWILFALCACAAPSLWAQGQFASLERLVEDIAEDAEDEDIDLEQLVLDLAALQNQPLDLNTATREDFEKLQFLDHFEIMVLLRYRAQVGQFRTLYELLLLEGWNRQDIDWLMPFVSLSDPGAEEVRWSNALRYGRHQFLLRSQGVPQTLEGFRPLPPDQELSPNARYLGDPLKHFARYGYAYSDKLRWGLTAEKDAGEEFFRGSNRHGFDFYSAHLQLAGAGPVENLVLGDFQAQFGQGLVQWAGLGIGKTPYVLNIDRRAQGLRRFASADENQFFRGAGATLRLGAFRLTGFYSDKARDANLDLSADSLAENEEGIEGFTSLQISGLHATPAQVEDEKSLRLRNLGANLAWQGELLGLGATFSRHEFSEEALPGDRLADLHDPRGRSGWNLGADYRLAWRGLLLLGETATDQDGNLATLNAAKMQLGAQVSLAALHRSYSPAYRAPFARGFGETTATSNERGFYLGAELHPARKWTLLAYADLYSFPWARSTVDRPSQGQDYFAQLGFLPSRQVSMYWRFKTESRLANVPGWEQTGIRPQEQTRLTRLRFHIDYPWGGLELRSRVEANWFEDSQGRSMGFLAYQDLNYAFAELPLKLYFRYAIFEAETFDNRLYAYENDVLYAFSIPAYFGRGTRFYAMARLELADRVDLWLRYAQTSFADRATISSGLNEIQGSLRSEFKAQLRVVF